MKIRDLLLEDVLNGAMPCYDKEPEGSAFVVGDDGTSILLVSKPVRVWVPMVEGLDADVMTLTLVKITAEQGSTGIEWAGDFTAVRAHFDERDLPFHVLLKHPESPLPEPPPTGVVTLEDLAVEKDRFYCLTTPELLGRRPTRPGMVVSGIQCPDTLGLLIFNPEGILTVFLEARQSELAIRPQA